MDRPRLLTRLLTLLLLSGLLACQQQREPVPQAGIKVVPSGTKPAGAPGVKGTIIDMPSDEVRVMLVRPDGTAARAGFHAGDVIRAVSGQPVESEQQVARLLAASDAGLVMFEVARQGVLETIALAPGGDPGWLLLSGDTFKGILLERLRHPASAARPRPGERLPRLSLPGFVGPDLDSQSWRGNPAAVLFFTTFSEPCYALLQQFSRWCFRPNADDGPTCLAIDTLELFTAVRRTSEWQAELEKIRTELWTRGPLGVDLFGAVETRLGVRRVPQLLLLDAGGKVRGWWGEHELRRPEDLMKILADAGSASPTPTPEPRQRPATPNKGEDHGGK